MTHLLIVIIGICYLAFAWRTQLLINKSVLLTPIQKIINTILNWSIPFIWSLVTITMIKPPTNSVMTKAKRKSSKGNTDNWEHMTGGGGSSFG